MTMTTDFIFDPRSTLTMESVRERLSDLRHGQFRGAVSLDWIWTVSMFLLMHKRVSGPVHNKYYSRAHGFRHDLLVVHIAISAIEIALYYGTALVLGYEPPLTTTSLIICLLQCSTSLVLTSYQQHLAQGHFQTTRATFHCMALQRLIATAMAIYTGSSAWQKVSVKLLNNFIWVRLIGLNATKLAGFDNHTARYTVAVVGGHLVSLYEADFPHGLAVYLGLMALLLKIDKWAQTAESPFNEVMIKMGLASWPDKKEKPAAESPVQETKAVDWASYE